MSAARHSLESSLNAKCVQGFDEAEPVLHDRRTWKEAASRRTRNPEVLVNSSAVDGERIEDADE